MMNTTTRTILILVPLLLLAACTTRTATRPTQPERNARNAVELAARAEKAQRNGQWAESVTLNRAALEANPAMGGAWNNLGVGLMQTNDNLEAANALQRAAELMPTDPKPFENLALLHMNMGWHDDALRLYDLSLERSPYWLPSLRGSVLAAKNLNRSTDDGLDRIKRALLIEKDASWRRLLETEQVRVSQDLAETHRAKTPTN